MTRINLGLYSKNGTTSKNYEVHILMLPGKYNHYNYTLFNTQAEARQNLAYVGSFNEKIYDDIQLSIWVVKRKTGNTSKVVCVDIPYKDYLKGDNTVWINVSESDSYSDADTDATKGRIIINSDHP